MLLCFPCCLALLHCLIVIGLGCSGFLAPCISNIQLAGVWLGLAKHIKEFLFPFRAGPLRRLGVHDKLCAFTFWTVGLAKVSRRHLQVVAGICFRVQQLPRAFAAAFEKPAIASPMQPHGA